MRSTLVVCFCFLLTGCVAVVHGNNVGPGTGGYPEYLPASGAPATLPFSDAVRVGGMLYLSGKLGTVPGTTGLISGGIAAETRQALENIQATLEANGSSMDRVVRCRVMLADMKEWSAMNAVYATFFSAHKPARSAFGASGLALNARVEIECSAMVG